MPVTAVMTAGDVVEILGWLGGGDIEVWLDGGWALMPWSASRHGRTTISI